jgi:hypothetical protein
VGRELVTVCHGTFKCSVIGFSAMKRHHTLRSFQRSPLENDVVFRIRRTC